MTDFKRLPTITTALLYDPGNELQSASCTLGKAMAVGTSTT